MEEEVQVGVSVSRSVHLSARSKYGTIKDFVLRYSDTFVFNSDTNTVKAVSVRSKSRIHILSHCAKWII